VGRRRNGECAKPVERCLACEADEGSTQFRPFGLASEATPHGGDTNSDPLVKFWKFFLIKKNSVSALKSNDKPCKWLDSEL
jgi:hypothetical protein